MIYVMLVEPENEENVGAVARVMKNFGFKNLVIINPKCNPLSEKARKVSKHAFDILKKAKVTDFSIMKTFDYTIGTTSRLGNEYNFQRIPLTPENLADKLSEIRNSRIALLFGREGTGLRNEEIKKCDFIVTIPASESFPTMNLSHAVAIMLYEIQKKNASSKLSKRFAPASSVEKAIVFKKLNKLLEKLDFTTAKKKETQKIVWKKLVGKSFLSRREAFALFGFFKKIEDKIKNKKPR